MQAVLNVMLSFLITMAGSEDVQKLPPGDLVTIIIKGLLDLSSPLFPLRHLLRAQFQHLRILQLHRLLIFQFHVHLV